MKKNNTTLKYVVVCLLAVSVTLLAYLLISSSPLHDNNTQLPEDTKNTKADDNHSTQVAQDANKTPNPKVPSPDKPSYSWWKLRLVYDIGVKIVFSIRGFAFILLCTVALFPSTKKVLKDVFSRIIFLVICMVNLVNLYLLYKEILNESLLKHASGGSLNDVAWLLARGADIKYCNEEIRKNALALSAKAGRAEIVKYLLAQDIYLGNRKRWDKGVALVLSAHNGHLDCVKCLVEQGTNFYTKQRQDALQLAEAKKHQEIVDYLKNQAGR